MLSLDEPFIHRTNMITQNGFEFIGIYLAFQGVQWASTMPGKCTPYCKGAAKSIHSGEQQALEPVDIYWRVPHTVLVTLLSTRGWLMTQEHVNFSHHFRMCMWGVIKGFTQWNSHVFPLCEALNILFCMKLPFFFCLFVYFHSLTHI